MVGDWDADDLAAMLKPFAERLTELVPAWMQRLRHLYVRHQPQVEENTLAGARQNIERHYDLSNDLFALFLDESMTYSSAWFMQGDTLETAAGPQDRPAARRGGGCARHPHARARHRLGFARDPRRVRGARECHHAHDLERATGAGAPRAAAAGVERPRRRPTARLPRRGGPVRRGGECRDDRSRRRAVLADVLRRARSACHATRPGRGSRPSCSTTPGWSPRAISTPGSPSTSSRAARSRRSAPSTTASARHTGLRITERFHFGNHYARTLHCWKERFDASADDVDAIGFDDLFRRMWDSTSRTARRASPPAISTSRSSSSSRGTEMTTDRLSRRRCRAS